MLDARLELRQAEALVPPPMPWPSLAAALVAAAAAALPAEPPPPPPGRPPDSHGPAWYAESVTSSRRPPDCPSADAGCFAASAPGLLSAVARRREAVRHMARPIARATTASAAAAPAPMPASAAVDRPGRLSWEVAAAAGAAGAAAPPGGGAAAAPAAAVPAVPSAGAARVPAPVPWAGGGWGS
jgi:hypothetical protein